MGHQWENLDLKKVSLGKMLEKGIKKNPFKIFETFKKKKKIRRAMKFEILKGISGNFFGFLPKKKKQNFFRGGKAGTFIDASGKKKKGRHFWICYS